MEIIEGSINPDGQLIKFRNSDSSRISTGAMEVAIESISLKNHFSDSKTKNSFEAIAKQPSLSCLWMNSDH